MAERNSSGRATEERERAKAKDPELRVYPSFNNVSPPPPTPPPAAATMLN